MSNLLLADTRGKKSWHITLGVVWTSLFSLKAILSGFAITLPIIGPLTLATVSGAEYLLYITPWLGAMGYREYIEKIKLPGGIEL